MPAEVVNIGVAALIVLLLLEKIFAFVKPAMKINGKSGEQSTEFWELKFGTIIEKKMEPIVDATRKQTEVLSAIRDGIHDLTIAIEHKK